MIPIYGYEVEFVEFFFQCSQVFLGVSDTREMSFSVKLLYIARIVCIK